MKFDKKKNLDDAIKENQFKKLSQIKKKIVIKIIGTKFTRYKT
jgi:hypothetical protein